jgi:acyl-[acyl-carrier-protein]-phospholipid O-acyltransferase/long-chain-fatty-acid--[acyl-carrier-protein] ligase
METNRLYLFKDKRFLPLFVTQFCGCFNDNLIKSALVIFVTYGIVNTALLPTAQMILLANALFISPFLFFSSIAGQIADKYERSTIVRIIKFAEFAIILIGIHGFHNQNIFTLYLSLFLMGVHSTFFGPLKYSILPDHLDKDELLSANGYVEAGTFISILIGTLLGGFYTTWESCVIFFMLAFSVIGFISSFFLPKSGNAIPDLKINMNIVQESINILKYAHSKKQVFLSILGVSWFWFIGAAFIAEIPMLSKDVFRANENVANMFLAIFSIGVGIGSFWCNKLYENEITAKYVPISAICLSIFGIDLYFACAANISTAASSDGLMTLGAFLANINHLRILFDLFFISAISGLYVVPLFAVMQYFSSTNYRSRVIAANNIINSIFMIASTLLLSVLFKMNFSVQSIILVISIMNMVVAIYIHRLVPDTRVIPEPIIRSIIKYIFDKLYRVEVRGIENFHNAGKRVVIVANHISYIDPALIHIYLPEKIIFAVDATMSELGWVKFFLKLGKAYPIDRSNPMAAKTLINEIRKNKKIAIFPEGRISTTGSLMKIYEGPGMIADKADAVLLPIRIDGAQYTWLSKLKNLPKTIFFPKITITILPHVKLAAPDGTHSRQRRKYLSAKLYDIMCDMMFESSAYQQPLFQSLIDAAKLHGFGNKIIHDINNKSATYRQMISKSFILGHAITKDTLFGEYVGVMLPNSVASCITFFGMQAYGRVPTMINFTSGINNIISSCDTARVRTIYTSKTFIEKAELEELAKALEAQYNVIYLEDLAQNIGIKTKITGFIAGFMPNLYYNNILDHNIEPSKPAVVLFTSGTEGMPKAVVLSHINIQSNRWQIAARFDFGVENLAFNALPMFHCFGMTAMFLMTMHGIKTFFYPSPLHYRIIPELIYDLGATILFSTDTFLCGYAKHAHPYDFYALRYVIAGAEKLKSETRRNWFDKFGVRILEGYGVTETSPVISANSFMHDNPGTVGRFMPKIEYFIKPVEGITEGGLLCVKGPNIMMGYMHPNKPGIIVHTKEPGLGDGWYNTGDIVNVDEEGYIKILGRAKRFAKIAGEMVSLAIVEELAMLVDKDHMHAAMHIEDEKKGEQILLFTTSKNLTRDLMLEKIHKRNLPELYLPKYFVHLDDIPVMATGKTNYRALLEMAEKHVLKK